MRQRWTMSRTVAPTDLPLSVQDVKRQLNLPIDFTHHDEKLIDYIGAATEKFEADTDCVCMLSTFVLYVDALYDEAVDLIRRPIVSVDSITYLDSNGDRQTVDPTVYQISQARRQISLAYGQSWPAHERHNESVEITFTAGASTPSSVPKLWRTAVALAVGGWFIDPTDERPRDPWRTSYDAIVRRFFSVHEI